VSNYGGKLADYIEKHANAIASDVRDVIESSSWIPDSLRHPPTNASSHFFPRAPPPPEGFYEKTTAWISRNRTAISVVIAFVGTTVYLIHQEESACKEEKGEEAT
jgi:hypothetical protein